jgi:ABC-type glycerol-3-phosphate transport system permease component
MGYAVRQGLRYAVVVVVLGIVIVPFLWVFLASFRPNSELIQQGIRINFDTLTLDNYRNLQQAAQYFTYLTNSAIVAITSMIVSITLALLAAYSVYRTRYPGRRPLYLALIITYVFPGVVLLIPLYQLMGKVGLINNLLSLVIVNVTFTAPFSVWLMRGFFGAIPAGIEEAAAIDGAGRMRILFFIVLPLTAPGIAAAAIFSFVWSWTEYMFASAFIVDEGKKTLPVGLGAFIQQYNIDWGILTAAAVATAVPVIIVFAFIGRYFVEGLTAGAEK